MNTVEHLENRNFNDNDLEIIIENAIKRGSFSGADILNFREVASFQDKEKITEIFLKRLSWAKIDGDSNDLLYGIRYDMQSALKNAGVDVEGITMSKITANFVEKQVESPDYKKNLLQVYTDMFTEGLINKETYERYQKHEFN